MASRPDPSNPAPSEPLTRREREILALLAEGLTGPEIAARLTVAMSSVKSHLQHLYGKLGVGSKRDAVARARTLGLLGAPHDATVPHEPPSTAVSPTPPHNLPQALSRFFGREAEMAQLADRLGQHRLVTVTGPGGVGKTRLALRVAEELLPLFPGGVWQVALAALSDPELVAHQVATVIGLRNGPGRSVPAALIEFFRDRQALLVLDNCEHLLEACAQLTDEALRACARLRILATSREPLGLPGEAIWPVPSLPFPDNQPTVSAPSLADYPAVDLFVDRARLVRPEYQVTEANSAAIARICQRLEGIPLALEMAAARVNLLTAEQLVARLEDALQILTASHRIGLPRHQTLRATLDWSYQLLTGQERRLLRRLSVFAGGFTLEATEAVCADGTTGISDTSEQTQPVPDSVVLSRPEILSLLDSLIAKSMVRADHRPGAEARYDLLELVRQFAREKLDEAGEMPRLLRRHLAYFLGLAQTAFLAIPTRHQQPWAHRLKGERDNLRVALETAFGDPADANSGPTLVRLLVPLWPFSPQEARAWCQRAVDWCQRHPGVSGQMYARLLVYRARDTVNWENLPKGVAEMKAAVEFTRKLDLPGLSPLTWGAPEGKAILMFNLQELAKHVASEEKAEEALALNAEAEAILNDLGPEAFPPNVYRWIKSGFAGEQARLANKQGRYGDAKAHAAIMLQLMEANGDTNGTFGAHLELGHAWLDLGEYKAAGEHFRAAEQIALEIARQQAAPGVDYSETALVYTRRCLGLVALRLGDLAAAQAYCESSLREALKGQSPRYLPRGYGASTLALAAAIAAKRGQPLRAASLAGSAHALYADAGRQPWEDTSLETLLPGWRDRPDAPTILAAYEAGKVMSGDRVIALALSDADA